MVTCACPGQRRIAQVDERPIANVLIELGSDAVHLGTRPFELGAHLQSIVRTCLIISESGNLMVSESGQPVPANSAHRHVSICQACPRFNLSGMCQVRTPSPLPPPNRPVEVLKINLTVLF